MKNEPNRVRPLAAPIKCINGSKVCKDRVEVLWLLLNINTGLECEVKRCLGGEKMGKNAHFAQNKYKRQPKSD